MEHDNDSECIEPLCQLPAAAGIRSEAVLQLLDSALKCGRHWVMDALLDHLPAVLLEQLSSQQMKQLLAAAAKLTSSADIQ